MQSLAGLMLGLSGAILGVAALWHLYWAAGGRRGIGHAVPQRLGGAATFEPGPVATAIVGLLIGGIATFYAAYGWGLTAGTIADWVLIALALVFLVRAVGDFNYVGFFKARRGTAFAVADSRFYSPLCLILGISGLLGFATLST